MKTHKIRNSFFLFLTAFIWGTAFVAQSVGMDYVGPYTFICVRSFIAGIVLLPCIVILQKINPKETISRTRSEKKRYRKTLVAGGVLCGLALGVASCLQQIGIQYTTVGKAGFITAFYIIIVPVLGLFFGKRCRLNIWIGVILALFGLYFLCMTEGFSIGYGDAMVFFCALVFSIHILVIDYFTELVDGVKMSCIQFFVSGIVSGIGMILFEKPDPSAILAAWLPILYAGVLSSGVGYTLQIVGQKGINPTVASLILSLESVISVLAGMLVLGETLNQREIIGCVLMFAAIILAQIPEKKKTFYSDLTQN
ncbi:DMT family transporter [Sellimonas caecigallum]|uniref:DMT family transporter n=1 Tax=Sellimonas caecigallum TaxID=2592333 RepID=A0ABS7L5H5_9FIRM|nr:DMT family transporter [Sellimonas caecigallum]MBY0758193.1 DMT family transporter [Sellimonas caecigallum]